MLIGLCVNVWAYNPQITTYEVKNINDAWAMEISFPQVAVYTVLLKKDPFLLMIVVFGMCMMEILFWFKAFNRLNILRLTVAILLLLVIGLRYENDGSGLVFSSEASESVADATAKDGNARSSPAIATVKTLQEKPPRLTSKKAIIIKNR